MSALAGSTQSVTNFRKKQKLEDVPKRIYVLENVSEEVSKALKNRRFHCEKVNANVATDLATSCSDSLFIVQDFSSKVFDTICTTDNGILGPTAVLELICNNEPIIPRKNPVYCLSMNGLKCYISIKEKAQVSHLMKLIRSMGGSVRAKLCEAMYFIAETTLASGYLYSNTYNIPTMTPQWVEFMWKNRNIPAFTCDKKSLNSFTIKPFRGLYVAFLHFPSDERSHVELLEKNHGVLVDLESPLCTHVVIDDFTLSAQYLKLRERSGHVKIVHADWFWNSIQFESRISEDDFIYLKGSDGNAITQPVVYKSKNSLNWRELTIDPSLRFSLDSSEIYESRSSQGDCISPKCQDSQEYILDELLITEQNYIQVLEAIELIKDRAENEKQVGGPMINPTQSKQIFMNTQDLLKLHKNMLHDMSNARNKNEGKKAFNVFIKYKDDLKTHYPKFCNGFEEARKTIRNLSMSNPRFRALLEISKNMPGNGRQKLQELIHRPLQRLGSVTLLIKGVLEKTDDDCKDKRVLEEGLQSVEEALCLMNEELHEAEKLSSVFRVYASIKDCPVTLVSSHRCLRKTFFSQELTGSVSNQGDCLAFHLFSDVLEVSRCKKKIAIATLKNKEEVIAKREEEVLYKHLQLVPLHKIRKVVDIIDNNDVKDAFGLVVRETMVKDTVWCFRYVNDSENTLTKKDLVIFIAKCLARFECSGDIDKYWVALKPHEVDERLKTSLVPYQSSMKKLMSAVTDHFSPSSSKIAKLGTPK